jgi:steroid 5-alpha reductase family enzyme
MPSNTYLFYILIVFALMTALYVLAQWKKDNSIVDIFWGLGFSIVAVLGFLLAEERDARKLLVLLMVLIWGVRLAVYIGRRNRGKGEDYRYVQWRKEWGRNAWWRSYLQVFILQGAFMFIIALPIIHVMSFSEGGLRWIDYLGATVWMTGFIIEAIADKQMMRFKARPGTSGQLIDEGLWSISRHPNYLGEMILWWGVFIVSFSAPVAYLSFLSPVVVTWLLSSVSGVPMLERKYQGRPDF